jgi:hypothetical protein
MQTRLSFRDEPDPGSSVIGIGTPRQPSCASAAGPPIRSAQEELDVKFYRGEEGLAVGVGIGDEGADSGRGR